MSLGLLLAFPIVVACAIFIGVVRAAGSSDYYNGTSILLVSVGASTFLTSSNVV